MSSNLVVRKLAQKSVLEDNKQWTNRFEVRSESSNRIYVIAQHKTGRYWACSCPGWIRFKHCKHLETLLLPGHYKPLEITGKKSA